MQSQWAHKTGSRHEAGQAAAFVALLLFFVFLPLAALAIDGSMVYLVRRDLQNVADASALAACTELAQEDTPAAALAAAQNSIQSNLGPSNPCAVANPGQGVNLLCGIDVASSPDVRVAVQRPAPTVLTQFVGRGQTLVTAQAHCLTNAGGGLLPIAVRRDYNGQDVVAQDVPANKDYLNTSIEDTVTWPSPYPPYSFTLPLPKSAYTAGPSNPGPAIAILGSKANPINGNSNMKGSVLLDVRSLGSGNPDFFNGAYGNIQSNKDLSRSWMERRGYPGPVPGVGAQVGVLNGNWGANEMNKANYQPGDLIAVIIYDGYAWDIPGYNVALTPRSGNPNGILPANTYPVSRTSAVVYDIDISQSGGAWATPMNFEMKFVLNESPAPLSTTIRLESTSGTFLADVTNATYTALNVTQSAGWKGVLKIYSPTAGNLVSQTNQYVSGLDMIVTSSAGLPKGASSNYGFLTGSGTVDFTISTDAGSIISSQNGQVNLNLYALGVPLSSFPTSSCKNTPVQARLYLPDGATLLTWTDYFAAADQNSTMPINTSWPTKNIPQMGISVNSDAPLGQYVLRLTVGPCGGNTHSFSVPLEIKPDGSDLMKGSPSYVYIQGFATFEITNIKGGEVDAQCISPLVQSLDQVTVGLKPRLVPWN